MPSVPGELFGKRLDRDFTPEFRVAGTPDFSHAAFAEETDDFVVAEVCSCANCHLLVDYWTSSLSGSVYAIARADQEVPAADTH